MATTITYDSLKQKIESGGGLNIPPGEVSSGVLAGTLTGTVNIQVPPLPKINFQMEDLTYGTTVTSTELDVNTVLSLEGKDRKTNNYSAGSQVLINSSRIILNSKEDYLMLFGNKGVALASPGSVNIDADDSITLFGETGLFLGVPNKGNPTKDVAVALPKDKGDPTPNQEYEPLVLGIKLANLLEDLLIVIKNATILTPVGKGYFREDVMYELASLQARLPEMLSTYAYVDGISHSQPDPKPEKPKKVTEPPTSITGTVTGTVTGVVTELDPNTPGPVTNPLANQPDFYETVTLYSDTI